MHQTPAPGCRCKSCFDGKPHRPVAERDIENFLAKHGHPKPDVVKLHVLTRGRSPESECDGTMTCTCIICIRQRQVLDAARDRRAAQPWDVRPTRRAA